VHTYAEEKLIRREARGRAAAVLCQGVVQRRVDPNRDDYWIPQIDKRSHQPYLHPGETTIRTGSAVVEGHVYTSAGWRVAWSTENRAKITITDHRVAFACVHFKRRTFASIFVYYEAWLLVATYVLTRCGTLFLRRPRRIVVGQVRFPWLVDITLLSTTSERTPLDSSVRTDHGVYLTLQSADHLYRLVLQDPDPPVSIGFISATAAGIAAERLAAAPADLTEDDRRTLDVMRHTPQGRRVEDTDPTVNSLSWGLPAPRWSRGRPETVTAADRDRANAA
jgi:hypothetical protein